MGSTAVNQLMAKPIIDLVGEVGSLAALDEHISVFEALGYSSKGEFGIVGRRYLVLQENGMTFVHLHIFVTGDSRVADHIRFRDYLRENIDAMKRYQSVKHALIADRGLQRTQYSERKSAIIKELSEEALKWKCGKNLWEKTLL